jgi:phosphoribosyl-AMP cyclohydrolase
MKGGKPMANTPAQSPARRASDVESGLTFQPKFDDAGLIPAVVSDAGTGEVLMMAWMNREALGLTLKSRLAHFWSRSRRQLWKKGEASGNVLRVIEMRTDCDQDTLWLKVTVEGDGLACHTGQRSCFYRRLPLEVDLSPDLQMQLA